MCYDAEAQLKAQLKRAEREHQAPADVLYLKQIIQRLENYFHVSGFSHPTMAVYTAEQPLRPQPMRWGLIPHWTKSFEDAIKRWNNSLNCRAESMFEKASFRNLVYKTRCVIPVNAFYEHHHAQGKTFPYHISMKNDAVFYLGGLCAKWVDHQTNEVLDTFTIITTKGNELLAEIHNNPKMAEARMPLIIEEESIEQWLDPALKKEAIEALITSYPAEKMQAHTVRRLRGKFALGNVEAANAPFHYEELNTLL